jgi:hypothetical protein
MMIDDDDHPRGPHRVDGGQIRGGQLEESAQSRYLFDAELRVVRPLEEFTLGTDDELTFIAAVVRQHPPQMSNELDGIGPMQTARQFAVQEASLQHR